MWAVSHVDVLALLTLAMSDTFEAFA